MRSITTAVLLIEDNPGDARLVREMFNEQGAPEISLTCVGTMAEAERHLALENADIILLDLGLPDAEGLTAVQRVRSASHAALVVLTGRDDESLAAQALQEGAQDYLIKGELEPRGFFRFVRHALERDRLEKALTVEKELTQVSIGRLHESELTQQRDILEARSAARSAAKSAFLAQMSHEIRTPMNGVLGMAFLLMDTTLTPEQREYVETIQTSSTALLTVINDILYLSHVESGKLTLSADPFSVRETLSAAAKVLAVTAAQKSLELVLDIDADVPDAVNGDSSRLRQMILNLTGNAVKFTDRGEVVISASVEHRGPESTVLHFSVRDTGSGIPTDRLERLFEAFEQLDTSDARSHSGTGLGLTITRGLAELMGGRAWAESEVGVGSTFHVTAKFAVEEDASLRNELHGISILLIEKNAALRSAIDRMLTAHGADVSAFAGWSEFEQGERPGTRSRPYDDLVLGSSNTDTAGVEDALSHGFRADQIVMLLSAATLHADARRLAPFEGIRYLVKPVAEHKAVHTLDPRSSSISEPVKGPKKPIAPLRVLLVEDNLVNQRVASRFLDRDGHTTVLASNGREALDAFRRHSFDLILMDVQMPEIDGITATCEIRKLERPLGLHTPIIALTAHVGDDDRNLCVAAGMDGYLSKPIDPTELRVAIAESQAERSVSRAS